jgi:alpha-1,3-glucosyltransferase
MAANSKANLRVLVVLSAAGIFSLYPLLFLSAGKNAIQLLFQLIKEISDTNRIQKNIETPIKITLTLLWFVAVIPGLAFSVKT